MVDTLASLFQKSLCFTMTAQTAPDGEALVCLTIVGVDNWRWIGSAQQARRLIGEARYQDLRSEQQPSTWLQRIWKWQPRGNPKTNTRLTHQVAPSLQIVRKTI